MAAEGTILWHDLEIRVRGQLKIETHSGSAQAGRLLGVIGPSGAGKSLLLHALAGLAPSGATVTGCVWDAGGKVTVGVAEGTVALLEQDVPFFSELTPRETVRFAAELEGLTGAAAKRNADALLRRVGLEAVADQKVGERYVGSSGQGMSGGEQRRLAVACAIAGEDQAEAGSRRAKSLLADEPTTGLDTFQAAEIVQLLREMAAERCCATVVTIHQPRSSVWQMIDDVLLLAPGGRVIFWGPTADVVAYFTARGHACPREGVNPAEFLVDLVSVRTTGGAGKQQDQARVELLRHAFRYLQAEQRSKGQLPLPDGSALKAQSRASGVGSIRAFGLLFRRAVMQTTRDRATNLARLAATGGLGFIFGAQFGKFDEGPIYAGSVSSRVALISFGGISMCFIGMMRALDRFAKEKKVIMRERAASRYSGVTYLAAKAFAELPSDAFFAALFGAVMHHQCGLRGDRLDIMAACALTAVACAALGLAIGAAVPNQERALMTGVPVMVVHMLTGIVDPAGAAAQQPNAFMVAMRTLSPVRYVIEALSVAELQEAELIRRATDITKAGLVALASSGDVVLEQMGITHTYKEAMQCLAILLAVHLALAAFFLAWSKPASRRAKPLPNSPARASLAAGKATVVPVNGNGARA